MSVYDSIKQENGKTEVGLSKTLFQILDRIFSAYEDVFNEKETKRNHKSRKCVGNLYLKKNAEDLLG